MRTKIECRNTLKECVMNMKTVFYDRKIINVKNIQYHTRNI